MAKKWLTRLTLNHDSDWQVVDQPGRSDQRGSDQAHLPAPCFQRLESGGVDQGEIVDLRESRRRRAIAFASPERRPDRRAAEDRPSRRFRAFGSATALPRSSVRQVDVARREREAVRFAHCRHADDLDRNVQIARPSGGSRPAAENPFRRTARHRAGPRAAAWRRPSPPRRNGRAALRLPTAPTRRRLLTVVAKPSG